MVKSHMMAAVFYGREHQRVEPAGDAVAYIRKMLDLVGAGHTAIIRR